MSGAVSSHFSSFNGICPCYSILLTAFSDFLGWQTLHQIKRQCRWKPIPCIIRHVERLANSEFPSLQWGMLRNWNYNKIKDNRLLCGRVNDNRLILLGVKGGVGLQAESVLAYLPNSLNIQEIISRLWLYLTFIWQQVGMTLNRAENLCIQDNWLILFYETKPNQTEFLQMCEN